MCTKYAKGHGKGSESNLDRYNQDAVLRVTAYGGARLSNNDGTRVGLGAFKQVDSIPADQCYTQSFKTGNIYVTLPL